MYIDIFAYMYLNGCMHALEHELYIGFMCIY